MTCKFCTDLGHPCFDHDPKVTAERRARHTVKVAQTYSRLTDREILRDHAGDPQPEEMPDSEGFDAWVKRNKLEVL